MIIGFVYRTLLFLGTFLAFWAHAEEPCPFALHDLHYSSKPNHTDNASVTSFTYNLLSYPVECYRPDSSWGRLASFVFLELPLANFLSIVQHELGHGTRFRELDLKPEYKFYPPVPYSFLNGNTRLGYAHTYSESDHLSFAEEQLIKVGGLQANLILSQQLLEHLSSSDYLPRSMMTFYMMNKFSTPLYGIVSGREIEGKVWQKNVREKSLINILDPIVFAALIQNYTYFSKGGYYGRAPWTSDLPEAVFLPLASYSLIPFGESYELSFLHHTSGWQGYYSAAIWKFTDSSSRKTRDGFLVRFKAMNVNVLPRLTAGMSLLLSKQPDLFGKDQREGLEVFAAEIKSNFQVCRSWEMVAKLGTKGRGYIPEYSIHSGTFWSVGMGWKPD